MTGHYKDNNFYKIKTKDRAQGWGAQTPPEVDSMNSDGGTCLLMDGGNRPWGSGSVGAESWRLLGVSGTAWTPCRVC